jgi:hypothetical protein
MAGVAELGVGDAANLGSAAGAKGEPCRSCARPTLGVLPSDTTGYSRSSAPGDKREELIDGDSPSFTARQWCDDEDDAA